MEISYPNFNKSFSGPLGDNYYTELNIPAGKLTSSSIPLLHGEGATARGIFLKIIMSSIRPDWSDSMLPQINAVFKPQIYKLDGLNCDVLQINTIHATLRKTSDIYIFDEPTAFLNVEQSIQIAQLIRDFITKHEKIAIISSNDPNIVRISDNIIEFLMNIVKTKT